MLTVEAEIGALVVLVLKVVEVARLEVEEEEIVEELEPVELVFELEELVVSVDFVLEVLDEDTVVIELGDEEREEVIPRCLELEGDADVVDLSELVLVG